MYLSRLELQGFKSFAKKTVFEFPEKSNHDQNAKSITAVVGPNGSGKSNVSDAIRWVLGEQSLKLIRCKKADDVIFGGSASKARQGLAEVSIFFNNEDKQLPIDYSEVVITRRVYRDGETEYLINKKKARLFDILMLLAKANFGQRSYSIIGQGMVDHIINISAFERKEFFDEATGVKQYQIKRDQSVNRLRRSRENLTQTNQILQELEPRLRLLTRQIKKLEKRKEIETILREKQKQYYGFMWHNLHNNQAQLDEDFNVKDALRSELQAELDKVQSELAGYAKEESRKDVFNNLQKKYNKLIAEKNEILKELTVLKGKMSLEYVKAGKQNLSWLEDKKEELFKRINEIKEASNNSDLKLSEKGKTLEQNEEQIIELDKELVLLQNNLNAAELDLARIKSGGKRSEAKEAVNAVLRQKDYIKGIYGTVSDLASMDQMYEAALSTLAGGRQLAIVVQNDEVAVQCINYLKENKLAPLTFFPLNKLSSFPVKAGSRKLLEENGAIGFAIELINFDAKYKKVFEQIFGSAIIVDNIENANQMPVHQEKLVTLQGDIIEKSGVMKGGFLQKNGLNWLRLSQNGKLASQEEKLKQIEILKSKIDDRIKQKNNLAQEINELKVELQVNDTKSKGLSNELNSLQKELEKVEDEISSNQISPADQDKFMKNLNLKKKELENKLTAQEEEILEIKKDIDQFNLEEENKKTAVFKLQRDMQGYQSKLNEVSAEVQEIKISLAKLETKKEELEKEISQELGAEFKVKDVKADEIVNPDQFYFEISKLKHNLEQIGGIDPEIVDEHKEVSERYEFLSTQVIDLEKAIKDLEKIIEELDVIINKQFSAQFKKINQAFGNYFSKIFEGGKAKLDLVQKESVADRKAQNAEQLTEIENSGAQEGDAENSHSPLSEEDDTLPEEKSKLVNTGIEIMVAPPNKKIANIAVLSGGERTMTSLALICAIIESNPAPFIVMDEVDAALDESNSEKFGAILQDLSYKSQFIVITHNRVIMHVADVLYGVAMGDDGISKTLSLSLKETADQD